MTPSSNSFLPTQQTWTSEPAERQNNIWIVVAAYNEGSRLDSTLKSIANGLGAIYLQQGHLEDAFNAFQTAVEQNHPEAKYNLAMVYLKQNQLQQAIPLFQEVIDKHPEFPSAVRQLAWILATVNDEHLRNVERAQRLMQTHFDLNSTQSVYVLDTFGAIQAAQGEFAAAIQTTQKALTLAQSRDKPNAALINDLEQRIQHYQNENLWIGRSQP